ncbi:MAG TPA: FAD-dependent oxidoreductase [Cyanobacteria bacterium UBA10660]|nr:MAG TPA: FAD-dependent oxidoreductase [Candidatus Gastranaerophilales bacterium HUM_1]HAS94603.1 FAD-dependent oxidoreductase [Cyanobacteria bacterium UBA10660]
MNYTILGGGLSAISLAYYLQENKNIDEIHILEKDDVLGGICRTYVKDGIEYDVGPHIIFSKDKEILDLMNNLLGENNEKHRRSNRILHKKRFVQYPFENDLSKLPKEDIDYCVNGFLHNPYENYDAKNMLQFFLKTFGEGITNTYLRPYNEKIWKFDPSFMDTQMVERIPKPPKEDILRSANGETIDGYLHQLYFTYPKQGGTEALIKAFISKLGDKVKIHTDNKVLKVKKQDEKFVVTTSEKEYLCDKVVSTMPANEFCHIYEDANKPQEILNIADNLRYNSIAICIVNVNKDYAGDNYAFMVADKNVKFHRISKLDFMGEHYHIDGTATYMAEITYRKNDLNDKASDEELTQKVIEGLETIGFIESKDDVNFTDLKRFEYAYVIYDLKHRQNMDAIKEYFVSQGIYLNGRFGSFEYLNMDAIIRQSEKLAKNIKE